ncbi:fibronectin type III domain-containing protein [Patescibacteria group bacterium]|nr:fibronectin type III domain-containing protein [Patescibacteria group bacterium]
MLVKKVGFTKKIKILLILLVFVVVVGGSVVYLQFYKTPAESNNLVDSAAIDSPKPLSISSFDETIFQDAQLFGLAKDQYEGFTEQYEAIILDPQIPLSPDNISVNNPAVGQKLIISWQTPDFVNYTKTVIYRSESLNALGKVVATIENSGDQKLLSYQDDGLENKQPYYYLVRNVNANGDESTNILQSSGVPTDNLPPDPPAEVKVTSLDDKTIEVSWKNPSRSDQVSVRIYRSSVKGILGSLIAEGSELGGSNSSDTYFFIDRDVNTNSEYYYTVTSVDSSDNESSSNILSVPYNSNPFEPF